MPVEPVLQLRRFANLVVGNRVQAFEVLHQRAFRDIGLAHAPVDKIAEAFPSPSLVREFAEPSAPPVLAVAGRQFQAGPWLGQDRDPLGRVDLQGEGAVLSRSPTRSPTDDTLVGRDLLLDVVLP